MKNKVFAVLGTAVVIAAAPVSAASATPAHHYHKWSNSVDVAYVTVNFPTDPVGTNAWHRIGAKWYEYSWRAYRALGNDVPADVATRLAAGDDI